MREAFGDRGSGAMFFRDANGVGGSGAGDTAMAIGENSNSEMDDRSGIHDTTSVNEGCVLADRDVIASTGALGFQASSGGFGRSSEAGVGATREPGAQTQTLEAVLASILKEAWQGVGTAAGSDNVWRDDVAVRSARNFTRRGEAGRTNGLDCVGAAHSGRLAERAREGRHRANGDARPTGCRYAHRLFRYPASVKFKRE